MRRQGSYSDVVNGTKCASPIKVFLYGWNVLIILLGLGLLCIGLYLLYYQGNAHLVPTLAYNLAMYTGLALALVSCVGLFGLQQQRRCTTDGSRNYVLGLFILLGALGAIVISMGGIIALTLKKVADSAEANDFTEMRVKPFETAVITLLDGYVKDDPNGWREMQNSMRCCAYASVYDLRSYSKTEWDESVLAMVNSTNSVSGRYCSRKSADCRAVDGVPCPLSKRTWCREEVLSLIVGNYSLLGVYAIVIGCCELVAAALSLFTLLCDVRMLKTKSPTIEIPQGEDWKMPRRAAVIPNPSRESPVQHKATLIDKKSKTPPLVEVVNAPSTRDPQPTTRRVDIIKRAPSPQKSSLVFKPAQFAVTKKIVRPPKYHETKAFRGKESVVSSTLDMPWYLGWRAAECYRLAATLRESGRKAALLVRPIAWGYGTRDGALGHNNTEHIVRLMKKITAFRGDFVTQVSAGTRLSLFLTDGGRVLQSGRLFLKQDGPNMWKPRHVRFEHPVVEADGEGNAICDPTGSVDTGSIRIIAVEAGHLAGYALNDQGRIYSWGTQRYGQLGHGEDTVEDTTGIGNREGGESVDEENLEDGSSDQENDEDESEEGEMKPKDVAVVRIPRLIQLLDSEDSRFTKLCVGNHFVLAITALGHVYSWGWNSHGQLGLGEDALIQISTPQRVPALSQFVVLDISAGHSHSLAVTIPRRVADPASFSAYSMVFSWGRGVHGCLGIGGASDMKTPQEVTFFRGLCPGRVAAGHDHSLVVCAAGSRSFLYAFGSNVFGQLGIARNVDHVEMPMMVEELTGLTLTAIGAGAYASAALTSDGEVYTWGDARYGKTARTDNRTTYAPWKVGDEHAKTTAVSMTILPPDAYVTQLSVGAHHSLALYRTEGRVDRWRNFPMGNIVTSLDISEGQDIICVCDSARCSTPGVFGIFLFCENCSLGPVCRLCTRRCHARHRLVPRTFDGEIQELNEGGTTQNRVRCACGRRRPRLQPILKRKSAQAPAPPVQVPIETTEELYCEFVKVPDPIPEETAK
ncbi:hypothetical protein Poli38472_011475 [Pythium oligandrum]|uniref:Uncharacterized protein n=1 Tax=Pythium oligandrum TaxID=41045 RepID=A0A8K1CKZ8_PYTOL|nr:hypothetical protein Poli38472_011475 [Pythium oligandrum]|eukprot:TMW64595.1 hypothetical protein Poli38472_011475 [Pythium oligandrum]